MRHNKKFNHLGRTASHRKALLANMASSLIKHKRITTTVAKAKALRVYIEPLITKSKAANNTVITPIVKTVEVTRKDGSVEKIERTINVNSSTSARRLVFSYLKDKEAVKELFGNVASKVADRPGGYTRVLKTGFRQGDAAEMAIIELVDFNEAALVSLKKKEVKKNTRRSRRKSSSDDTTGSPAVAKQTEKKLVAPVVEDAAPEQIEDVVAEQPVVEDVVIEQPVAEDVVAEQPVTEDVVTEQPVAEDIVTEQPVTEDVVAEQPVAEDVVAEQPVAEDVVAEQPVAEDVVAEQPVAEDVVQEEILPEQPENENVDE